MPNRFEYTKRGYNPEHVDKYIQELELSVKEYREKDGSIANAILSAQLAADEIVKKANVAASTLIENARNMSIQLKETSERQVADIIRSVQAQKEQLAAFKEDYNALISKYILSFDDNGISEAERKAVALESYLQKFLPAEEEPDAVREQR